MHPCRHRGGQESESGFTLIELLIAIVLLGTSLLIVLTAWGTNLRASSRHRDVVNAQAVVASAAERLSSRTIQFRSCLTNSTPQIQAFYQQAVRYLDYSAPTPVTPVALPAGWDVSNITIQSVDYWNGEITPGNPMWTSSCKEASGLNPQRIVIKVVSPNGRATERVEVIKDDF
jgi:prepilin-type N-terminal cleavage/methylation domain-containing protein